MPRFFVKKEDISDGVATLYGDDARHIARSLRMAVGDELTLTDGEGMDYVCRLSYIRDEECRLEICSEAVSSTEPPIAIDLYMAYPKGDKLEIVIQKAVELGASRIIPFESSRCIKRPKAEKIDKQIARLSRIAEEAAKQCGRSRLPSVEMPMSFAEMLSSATRADRAIFCYEDESEVSLKSVLCDKFSSISIIIGSEGGFSPEEAEAAKAAGAIPVSLGKRILRCETAPSFVLAAISYEFEL